MSDPQPIAGERALELVAAWERKAAHWRAAGGLCDRDGQPDRARECQATADAYAHCALVLRTEIEG